MVTHTPTTQGTLTIGKLLLTALLPVNLPPRKTNLTVGVPPGTTLGPPCYTTLPSVCRLGTSSFHQHAELIRSAWSGEDQRFFSWRRLWERKVSVIVLMARTRSKRTMETTDPGATEGSRRKETGTAHDAGGSALSGERRQQMLQFVTENLPMLEDIIRQAKERGEAGGAQTSKVKGKEKESPPEPSEDESRDQPPRRKRPRTPPRQRVSVVGDSERYSRGRTAGSRPRDPSPRKPVRNEPERSPARSVKSRPRDPPQWKPVRDELKQILRLRLYEDNYVTSPFTREIEDCPLPRRFKIPNIELYDASTDPEDHLSVFLTHMCLQTAADEIRCKTFPMFLKGKARLWFQGLAPGSIRNFPELARQFVAQFVSLKNYSKNATHLMAIRQKSDESLRNYMSRFNAESLQIRDKDEKVVMVAFMNGLRVEELFYKLAEKPPGDVDEFLIRAHAATNAEEASRLKRESDR
uniref:Putative gag protein n=1 Tax=Coffea canephora TaxID=49390 RepID=A0A0B5D574_COFCA|nr:putative gag protein [Coffea canephora]